MSDTGGRARGFGARGRGFQSAAPAGLGGDNGGNGGNGGNGNGGNGNGGGNGAADGGAMRGRGGYHPVRPSAPIRTIPPNIHATAGEGGQIIRVQSNYFRLITPKNVIVQQYHVDFEPNVEATKVRRGMLYDQKAIFNGIFLFDGGSNIKSLTRLPQEETVIAAIRKSDNEAITITIKYTGEVGWGHPEMIRLYNTQIRRNLFHLNYVLIGRYMFDPKVRHKLPEHKLEIWQGLVTAVNDHDGGLLMVCDTVHKFVRSDTVLDILKQVFQQDRQNFKDNARRELAGSIVMSSYNNKTYRIDDIDFEKKPTSVFERRTGSISFLEYYKEQYKTTIQDVGQPLLQCLPSERQKRAGHTEAILLVPELCIMTGLTESLRSNIDVKRQSMDLTRMDPARRVTNLNQFMNTLQTHPKCKEEMDSWNINFESNVVELPARVLPCEKIMMKNETEGTEFNQQNGDFSKEMRSKAMRVPVEIPTWGIICTQRDASIVDEFSSTLNRVCGPLGIRLNRPNVIKLQSDRLGAFVDACKAVPSHVKIIVIIVPNNNKDRYDTIKKIFCCDNPIASQVVVFRTLSRKNMLMSICTKIGIQMACKLGAEAWALNIPPKNLMVIGYDTYHDSVKKSDSVGGFVCSLNPSLTRWYSRVSYHKEREEMSNNFSVNFQHGLKHYYQVSGRLPERIVVYRDGVADNQIQFVFEYELQQIKNAIKAVAGEEVVRLAFVIVTKRVNARFFARMGRDLRNPIPGTIVDTVVTRKERYDFYLISQSVRQGTVSPTMYNIIEDETNWKPTHHQQLAYKLTHLYFNWQGTISVPAPCQYAHKLAFLTGTALHREPAVSLSDTLFYL